MDKIPHDIAQLLDNEAARINSPSFIADDPVQFPRRFTALRDIEIAALLASILAWGNRKMICRDIDRLLQMMDGNPWLYVKEQAYEQLPDDRNIHRTFFTRHLRWLLRGLSEIYSRYPSLDAFNATIRRPDDPSPAWTLAEAIQRVCCDANRGEACSRALPSNFATTALKRFNMMLRWLVRDDGIVDLGVWKSIDKRELYIPLDVHVGNVSRELGLLSRKANDRKSVEQLTSALRTLRPDDPCLYDYALFGIGIGAKVTNC